MERNEYGRDALFHHEQEPLTILPKEPVQADTKQACFEEVNTKIPFCCAVNIPHGFAHVPNGTHKIVYNLDCVSVVKETCRKNHSSEWVRPYRSHAQSLKSGGMYSLYYKCNGSRGMWQ
ncbi:hypothetical protein CON73_15240 [Bacillus toyonensis]|uniref:Uncharacterized protein n=1 Tax=Bacillus toyonensis TaxID=155322 RepID=A0A2B7W2R6_9BACI|nr:hypothetical protein [Bacillus toyonensis]PGG90770.1 hypothetical protein CON73_15240 [Bacillus toyonensis]